MIHSCHGGWTAGLLYGGVSVCVSWHSNGKVMLCFSLTGHGEASGERSYTIHWYFQLHHHQDREPIEDSQDCPGCEPGGVSSLPPAGEAEEVLQYQR